MSAVVLRGDARRLPLPDASVDLVITSPPYFALRSYTDGGRHYDGQIGSEATPAEFLEALWECTREWVRVLKPSGSLWINLGDKYDSSSKGGPSSSPLLHSGPEKLIDKRGKRRPIYGRPKSLMGLPWRYAIGCIDQTLPYHREQYLESLLADVARGDVLSQEALWLLDAYDASPKSKGLGLILRAEVIWDKPNGLPESVTDRVRRSHEQWFHLVKQPRYYAAVDEIREPQRSLDRKQGGSNGQCHRVEDGSAVGQFASLATLNLNPLGKLPGSVWTVATEPLAVPAYLGVDHFAAFPTEWPRRIIAGWSPPGICTACGEGRRPISSAEYVRRQNDLPGTRIERNGDNNRRDSSLPFGSSALRLTTITGYACACPEPTAPTRPSVILDPCGGTGTVALVARALGRVGVTVDLSMDYSRLAAWRTTDRGELAKAMRVPKPPVPTTGQGDLFAEADRPSAT